MKVNLACSAGVGAAQARSPRHYSARSKQYGLAAGKSSTVTVPFLARQRAAKLAVTVAPVIGTAPELTTLTLKPRS